MTHDDARFTLQPTRQAQVFCGESMSGGWVPQKDGMGAAEVIFASLYMIWYARSFFETWLFPDFGVTMFLVFYIQYISIYDTVYIYIYLVYIWFSHLFSSSYAVAGCRYWWVELRRTGVRGAQHRSLWVAVFDLTGNFPVVRLIHGQWMFLQKICMLLYSVIYILFTPFLIHFNLLRYSKVLTSFRVFFTPKFT